MKHLLNDEQVRNEIERHKWIESERRGFDIGAELAESSWLELYGAEWIKSRAQSGNTVSPEAQDFTTLQPQQKKQNNKKNKNKNVVKYNQAA